MNGLEKMKINCYQTSNNLFVAMFPSQFSTNLTEFYRISAKESVKTWTISGSLQRQSVSECGYVFKCFVVTSLSCFVFWAETRTKLRSAANHKNAAGTLRVDIVSEAHVPRHCRRTERAATVCRVCPVRSRSGRTQSDSAEHHRSELCPSQHALLSVCGLHWQHEALHTSAAEQR